MTPSSRGLPTDRPMWSDESGLKECTKGSMHPPTPQWSWVRGTLELLRCVAFIFPLTSTVGVLSQVSEWAVDYNVPGGTDSEGWQYAADFPT